MIEDPNPAEDPLQRAVDSLNHALQLDPQAVWSMLSMSVPCGKEMALEHPYVQVRVREGVIMRGPVRENVYGLGFMGLLNGAVEAATGGQIRSVWSEPGASGECSLVKFEAYRPNEVKKTVKPEETDESEQSQPAS